MSDAEELVQAVEKSNKTLVLQTVAIVVLFMIQLYVMTISIRDFMGGDGTGLWLSAVNSIGLLVLSLVILALHKAPKI